MLAAVGTSHWKRKYDVFVSFRDKDTRKGFVSHLFHALGQAGIQCYKDDAWEERGLSLGLMLVDAIHCSRVSLIVFSSQYADSEWCLDELVEIMMRHDPECPRDVIPIFYGVAPSEIVDPGRSFRLGFDRCCRRLIDDGLGEDTKLRVKTWEDALAKAARLSGWHLQERTPMGMNRSSSAKLWGISLIEYSTCALPIM